MGDKESPNNKGTPPLRYRLNLLLFVLLMIAGTFWFQRHLQLYVTQVALVGGTMTLWGLFQLVQSWLKWGWGKEAGAWNERFLARQAATDTLAFLWIGFILLAFSTSSIYLELRGEARGESRFVVEVLNADSPLLPPVELTPYQKVGGTPFFLQWTARPVQIRIVQPPGYEPRTDRLAPWTGLRLGIPADFRPKKLRVLHLVPGLSIYQRLPAQRDYPDVHYFLEIEHAGEKYRLKSMRRQAVYAGADETDLRWLMSRQDREALVDLLIGYIARDVPSTDRGDFIQNWLNDPVVLPTREFKEGEEITIRVARTSPGGAVNEIVRQKITLGGDKLAVVFLEASL